MRNANRMLAKLANTKPDQHRTGSHTEMGSLFIRLISHFVLACAVLGSAILSTECLRQRKHFTNASASPQFFCSSMLAPRSWTCSSITRFLALVECASECLMSSAGHRPKLPRNLSVYSTVQQQSARRIGSFSLVNHCSLANRFGTVSDRLGRASRDQGIQSTTLNLAPKKSLGKPDEIAQAFAHLHSTAQQSSRWARIVASSHGHFKHRPCQALSCHKFSRFRANRLNGYEVAQRFGHLLPCRHCQSHAAIQIMPWCQCRRPQRDWANFVLMVVAKPDSNPSTWISITPHPDCFADIARNIHMPGPDGPGIVCRGEKT